MPKHICRIRISEDRKLFIIHKGRYYDIGGEFVDVIRKHNLGMRKYIPGITDIALEDNEVVIRADYGNEIYMRVQKAGTYEKENKERWVKKADR